ncbi:MAG: hypothetical protein AAGA31_19915, partial [Bacteroidota bacterium]
MTQTLSHFLVCLLLPCFAFAQAGSLNGKDKEHLTVKEAELAALAFTMHTDSNEEKRFKACKELIVGLVEALKTPNSFHYDFANLNGVNVLEAPDASFRIFSWELFINRDEYRHYGAIQRNNKELELIPLIDRGDQLRQNPENVQLAPSKWLGYVAYKIIPGGTYEGAPYYFLFGYDRYGAYRRRKIIDVLSFDGFGGATFGLPVFMTYNEENLLLPDRKRMILEYSASANVALKYEAETNRIIYENLVLTPMSEGDGPVNMPDGSYHALKFQAVDGKWHEVEKVFNHTYEKAPRDTTRAPVRLDILGRPIGGG